MKETNCTKENSAQQPTAKMLLDELTEVITDTFVATYEVAENALIMRIPNGQRFSVSVEEIQ